MKIRGSEGGAFSLTVKDRFDVCPTCLSEVVRSKGDNYCVRCEQRTHPSVCDGGAKASTGWEHIIAGAYGEGMLFAIGVPGKSGVYLYFDNENPQSVCVMRINDKVRIPWRVSVITDEDTPSHSVTVQINCPEGTYVNWKRAMPDNADRNTQMRLLRN